MLKVCFVSYEIHPITYGGVGVLIYNASQVLLQKGLEVIFILDIPEEEFLQFDKHDRLQLPNSQNCRAYRVDELCKDLPLSINDFISLYAWKSYRFHYTCTQVAEIEKPNIIEFFDYAGAAYYALAAKVSGLAYQDNHLAIRLHTSNEVMDINEPRSIDFEYYTQYDLEHHALRLAETVIYPSENYLREAYKPYYSETWLGHLEKSTPPFVDHPKKQGIEQSKNIILFYGRLYSLKGVDKFVEAALWLLSSAKLTSCKFFLVGHDSMRPPTGVAFQSYQDYLLQKIPEEYRGYFVFTGALSWMEMSELLPKVLLAVFPNYFESFCYAAHEMYASGIPIVTSNIPTFQDYFENEKNALIYNGSVEDLANKVMCLVENEALREKLSYPYPVASESMDDFYNGYRKPSWIKNVSNRKKPSLLICVINDKKDNHLARRTVTELLQTDLTGISILQLNKAATSSKNNAQPFTWLGELYTIFDLSGSPVVPETVRTAEFILVLRAGDVPDSSFIEHGLEILYSRPEISFVGCWRNVVKPNGGSRTITFPLDVMLELAPFIGISPHNRCIMRTEPNKLLMDLFDARSGSYGELQYLWSLDDGNRCGLIIPKVLMAQVFENHSIISSPVLAYLVLKERKNFRQARLARYSVLSYDQIGELGQTVGERKRSNTDLLHSVILPHLRKRWLTLNLIVRPLSFGWKVIKRVKRMAFWSRA